MNIQRYEITKVVGNKYRLAVWDKEGLSLEHVSEWDDRDMAVLYVHDHYPEAKSPETLNEERSWQP